MIIQVDDGKFDQWFSQQTPEVQQAIRDGLKFFVTGKRADNKSATGNQVPQGMLGGK